MELYTTFLTGNKMLNIAIIAWATAQVLKLIIVLAVKRKLDFSRLLGGGGMPSSHAAFVAAAATSAWKIYGAHSPVFAVAASLAVVVMYDASNIRRAAGEQAKILNYMMEHWNETTPEIFGKELKVFLGHTPVEVVAGTLLGILLGLCV